MKKRLRIIFLLAASSVVAILIFQAYWVYNSYETGARNFKASVSNALERSVEKYPLTVSKLPSTLISKTPYLTMVNGSPPITLPSAKGEKKKSAPFTMSFEQVEVSSANLNAVQLLVARLLTETSGQTLKLNIMSNLFRDELKKNNIRFPFKLSVLKNRKTLPKDTISAFVGFSKDNLVLVAEIPQAGRYVLSQNIIPAVVSVLLILLSAGSLYYMSLIIRKQMQMDGLKNDFINNITHELRTPVAILKSSHESLLNFSDLSDKEKTARHLKINVTILDKLDKNVDRILDITRYERGLKSLNYELVNIDEVVSEVIQRFSLREGSDLSYQSGINNRLVNTDSYIIETVLTNLVDNALKYSAENKKTVIRITTAMVNGGLQLLVADNGIGISEANLPYIFDKFFRVTSGNLHDIKGYGLGLSYVEQLINSLKGDISVKSKLGQGTEFIISLPKNE